jgi:tetraacyldisaccharide 4'-kinase
MPFNTDNRRKESIRAEIAPLPHQEIFFSTIRYGTLFHISNRKPFYINDQVEVLLVTGIANPKPLKKLLDEYSKTYYELTYSDHYIFTIDDLNDIKKRFDGIQASQKIIVTTEKDAVRLVKFEQELLEIPLYVIPIEMMLLFNDGPRFNHLITSFIRDFKLLA